MSNVDHPAHYGGADNPYEVIKVLEAWLTPQEFHGFLRGNVLKYEARAKDKGGIEDYEKAAWYQTRLVQHAKATGLHEIFLRPVFWNDDGETFDEADEVVLSAGANVVVAVHSNVAPHTRWGLQPHYVDETIVELFDTRAEAEKYLAGFIEYASKNPAEAGDGA
jgi:hypothetical protein